MVIEGDHRPAEEPISVCIIGAGAAGLAAAATLKRRGISAVVLERGEAVGTSWRQRYDRLHLHTTRRLSSLPGLAIPREFGRFVARRDVVRYLSQYSDVNQLHIRPDTAVVSIEQAPFTTRDGARWIVTTAQGEQVPARTVIVATGYNNEPFVPDWTGLADFAGVVIHASEYRNARPYEGQGILVVGVGNTGTEIAVDLAEGGAASVWLSLRTAPHIVRNTIGPWAAQMTGLLVRHVPAPIVDRIAALLARVSTPDLSSLGMPRPASDLYTRLKRDSSVPVQDMGIIDAIQRGAVKPVPGIDRFASNEVVLTDGRRLHPDVVIAATGYRTGLPSLFDADGAQRDLLTSNGVPRALQGMRAAPGLYFLGYTISIGGALRDISIEARRIARAEAKERRKSAGQRRNRRPAISVPTASPTPGRSFRSPSRSAGT